MSFRYSKSSKLNTRIFINNYKYKNFNIKNNKKKFQ